MSNINSENMNQLNQENDGFENILSKSSLKTGRKFAAAVADLTPGSIPDLSKGTLDVTKLSANQINELAKGQLIDVYHGHVYIHSVPKRAFMALSTKANALIKGKPAMDRITIKEGGNASEIALFVILRCVEKVTVDIPFGRNFLECLQVYQAAHVLGMAQHTSEVLKKLRVTVSARILSYAELGAVLKYCNPADPLFQHVAESLCYLRHQKKIPDPADFAKYLEQHADLSKAMEAIDQKHRARRSGDRRPKLTNRSTSVSTSK
ncbi:hypothetical protein EJ04DRAFT_520038 [Polyplosphaeria fusca]|uniref:Uncharacterized protein n=1 Tax=Polyplosphaeria fusca TaxID=682080 RepID=A0A9P4R4N2_9PLEO|nr:hypothetical protein EJ04DRAFT_520038 [Polyplosphaeria fusca]